MDKPYFIMSLDTELLWGPDTIEMFNFIKKRGKEARQNIDILLNLFERFEIPATWAIVGHLFLEDCCKKTCLTEINKKKYNFRRDWYIDPHTNLKEDPLFYGKDLIQKILSSTIRHEIGYHSFSHPIFSEIPRKMAEDEIKEAKKIEREWNIQFKSFVFPSNKIAHVDILKENGFLIYRGKTGIYGSNDNLFIKKFKGGIDKFISSPVEPKWIDGIWEIKGSTYFCDPQIPRSLLVRCNLGLNRAIRNKKIFHIWLHPWSLLLYKKLEEDLGKFLKQVSEKKQKNELDVITMGELAEHMNLLRHEKMKDAKK
ncbi:MAG: polysaccharide deacetylase family protein [Actinobacteria bacterium]|nr:polysaccharide deacetylase family protein [Actinomycetota bacterium]MBE3114418.1 polysaccharide deacetylase family protein [Actinomycetota bacterium]